jgi:hypothetical protein
VRALRVVGVRAAVVALAGEVAGGAVGHRHRATGGDVADGIDGVAGQAVQLEP